MHSPFIAPDIIALHTTSALIECIRRFRPNKSLIDNLGQVFAYLSKTMQQRYNRGSSLHLFINRSLPEVDVVLAGKVWDPEYHPTYRRLDFYNDRETHEKIGQILDLAGHVDRYPDHFTCQELTPETLNWLLKTLKVSENSDISQGILIPFDLGELNLGAFVLWGAGNAQRKAVELENLQLHGWIGATYRFVKEFLEHEYGPFTPATYLPSFYAARWKHSAILAADIHNFGPLSAVLRNIQTHVSSVGIDILRNILNQHCETMAQVIQQEAHGRVDHFSGSGLLAVFGEHEDNPTQATASAIYAAMRMIERFEQHVRPQFLKAAFGNGYDLEYNEAVNIKLRIGIDFGTVLFDYLGDDQHREYKVIGDHVDFAKWLQQEAMRIDGVNALHPNILISPTVERCARPWITKKREIHISEGPRGFTYTVWGIEPASFNHTLFLQARDAGDWGAEKYWGSTGSPPPML